MKSTNIPYLYSRNGIFYYRNRNIWKSLRTGCKAEAFKKLCQFVSTGKTDTPANSLRDKSNLSEEITLLPNTRHIERHKTAELVKAYLLENSPRWCAREAVRVTNSLKFLPELLPQRDDAIELKKSLLEEKTPTTFNRYLKYFNAFYHRIMANYSAVSSVNPFDNLKIRLKKENISSKRNAYSAVQLKEVFKLAESYGKTDHRYWLIMIGRYTGARMNEICQLKPSDITADSIHIRGDILKTSNALRTIPIHPKLIELGILHWISCCDSSKRLFHEWRPVKGSFSHSASRWFSRNNPFKRNAVDYVDFYSLRHTVATELKQGGIPIQYAAQIMGHSNGSITYDRYGKSIEIEELRKAICAVGSKLP